MVRSPWQSGDLRQAVRRARRRLLAGAIVCACSTTIVGAFWYQDWQYSLPTPRPAGYDAVGIGTVVTLPAALRTPGTAAALPRLLHFFNPACPCSRFNVDHLRALIGAYGDRVRFAAVLQGDTPDVLERAYDTLGLDIPYVVDDGRLAEATGVYSTPQAVVLDRDGRLFFRGNYNATRYCRDRDTEFARRALEAMLAGQPAPRFGDAATLAYGCPLRRPASWPIVAPAESLP